MKCLPFVTYLLLILCLFSGKIQSDRDHSKVTKFINEIRKNISNLFLLQDKFNKKRKRGKYAKCLVLTISDEKLQNNLHNQHIESIASILNDEYAKFHKYHYLYIYSNDHSFLTKMFETFPETKKLILDPKLSLNKNIQAFNFFLNQFRHKSWAKIPILWFINKYFGESYKYILYLNPKSAISPWKHQRSINTMIQNWKLAIEHIHSKAGLPDDHLRIHHEQTYHYRHRYPHPIQIHYDLYAPFIKYGNQDLTVSSFYFFNNFPYREDMPNPDIFIFKPGNSSLNMLEEWWNANISSKNYNDNFEVDALWRIIEFSKSFNYFDQYQDIKKYIEGLGLIINQNSIDQLFSNLTEMPYLIPSFYPKRPYLINSESISIVQENQHASEWLRYEENLWVINSHHTKDNSTISILNQFLNLYSFHSDGLYFDSINNISSFNFIEIDPLVIYQDLYYKTEDNRKNFVLSDPIPFEDSISKFWYNAFISSKSKKPLSLSTYYEGKIVQYKDSYYLISNGTKRKIDSIRHFKIPMEVAFRISDEIFFKFPLGNDVPKNISEDKLKTLFRYYQKIKTI